MEQYEQILTLVKTLLDPVIILAVAGMLISLLTSYFPKFNTWYAALEETSKKLGQLIAITVVVLLVALLNYTKVFVILPPGTPGVVVLVFSWLSALWTNQTTYKMTPQLSAVKEVKALSDGKVG